MNENAFKEILAMPELNNSAISQKMYPTNSPATAKTRLNNKLKEAVAGSGVQRLTPEDLRKGEEVLRNLANEILSRLD